ncbi:MAG: four helix bundle protein [Melioribacteraceae bacterium]|nr:MAG: four helix bundle protein [Melioribacteraceae bacterium]
MNGEKKYDLEDRTLKFAKETHSFLRLLNQDLVNREIIKQLTRSSASIGANYIEANESLSKKDFLMRIKISRKEAKETGYWLKLLECNEKLESTKDKLIQESIELMKIFGAILEKSK